MRRIQIPNNPNQISGIFNLPCVEAVAKAGDGRIVAQVKTHDGYKMAYEGDWITHDDVWDVEEGGGVP